MNPIIQARSLAIAAHDGQKRKYTGLPYIVHPKEVHDKLVAHALRHDIHGNIVDLRCAAYLHDVLEDNPNISEQQILDATNAKVLALVKELTNPSKNSKAMRAERKQMDRDHLKTVSPAAKVIKLIDRIVNLRDMHECDDINFWALYLEESEMLLKVLKGTDETLEGELQHSINFSRMAIKIREKDEKAKLSEVKA